jgi:hypothetical protein
LKKSELQDVLLSKNRQPGPQSAFFPESIANVPVDWLAEEIGSLRRRSLRAGRRGSLDPG